MAAERDTLFATNKLTRIGKGRQFKAAFVGVLHLIAIIRKPSILSVIMTRGQRLRIDSTENLSQLLVSELVGPAVLFLIAHKSLLWL
jgi:hypothetical protein